MSASAEPWVQLGVTLVAGVMLALRIRWAAEPGHWAVRALLEGPVVAIAGGVLLGWSAPEWVAEPFTHLVQPGFLFFAGWLGLVAGCGLDMRVISRNAGFRLAYELAAATAATGVVFAVYALPRQALSELPTVTASVVFVLAALCVVGPALPPGREALSRSPSRGNAGGRNGFWRPSAWAALAVLLVAIGTGLEGAVPFHLALPGSAALEWRIDSLVGRLLWGVGGGCLAGLLIDLATKDDFAPGGLYPQVTGAVLLAAGIAAAIGLEPLLVGAVAGFWLINATLRRLDVLHILDRGAALPRLTVPFLAAWLVGRSVRLGDFDLPMFAVVLLAVAFLRPALRLAAAHLVRRVTLRRGRRYPLPLTAELVELDELGLLLAAVLTRLLEPAAGASALAAALAGRLLLAGAARWWEHHEAVQAAQQQ